MSRELDMRVATRVMGWDTIPHTFSPSTDIADAWRVVDHMVNNMDCDLDMDCYGNDEWECEFRYGDGNSIGVSGAKTAPEVICKAALAAVDGAAASRG